jgi:hypothetical protein
LTLQQKFSKTYCPLKPIFTPPVSAIIYSAWRNGPRPGLAKNSFPLSTDARENGSHCRARQRQLPSELMAVTLESGMTRRLILK